MRLHDKISPEGSRLQFNLSLVSCNMFASQYGGKSYIITD